MNARPKKKLCWNCDGSVIETEDNCPYCGVYLHPGSLSGEGPKASLFSPPYPQEVNSKEEADSLSQSLPSLEEEEKSVSADSQEMGADLKKMLLTLLLLSTGVFFFLFGLAIFLFSENGYLQLTWSIGSGWVFFLSGLPMLIYGWRFLQRL